MKKIVRSIAVVALMFVVATGLAKEPKLSLTPNVEKSLNFEMDSASKRTFVSIVDTNGIIIYSENIAEAIIYSKKFDLKNLPEGSYFLKVEDALKETVFTFVVDDSEIVIAERKENTKPVFKRDSQRVFLNFLNLEKEEVKITVYNSESRVIFSEKVTDTMIVEKVFNFEKAQKDQYVVIVKRLNDTFYKDVAIN